MIFRAANGTLDTAFNMLTSKIDLLCQLVPNAPVVLVEYADYECPYCQQMEPVLDRIEAEYKGKVALAYKDVPLPMHPRAPKAAEAAHCAGAQGKYLKRPLMKKLGVPCSFKACPSAICVLTTPACWPESRHLSKAAVSRFSARACSLSWGTSSCLLE
jgi:Thioredoxin